MLASKAHDKMKFERAAFKWLNNVKCPHLKHIFSTACLNILKEGTEMSKVHVIYFLFAFDLKHIEYMKINELLWRATRYISATLLSLSIYGEVHCSIAYCDDINNVVE